MPPSSSSGRSGGVSTNSFVQLSNALWSVRTNTSWYPIIPAHLVRAYTIAYVSCFLGDQFLCPLVNFLLKNATGCISSSNFCSNTAPTAYLLASALKIKGWSGLTWYTSKCSLNAFLRLQKPLFLPPSILRVFETLFFRPLYLIVVLRLKSRPFRHIQGHNLNNNLLAPKILANKLLLLVAPIFV